MSFESKQPNYVDYLETQFGESLTNDNLKLVQSFSINKINDLINKFQSHFDHFNPIWLEHITASKSPNKILLPYHYSAATHGEFSPVLTPSQFKESAQLVLSMPSADGFKSFKNEMISWIKKALLLSHSVTLPSSIEHLFQSLPHFLSQVESDMVREISQMVMTKEEYLIGFQQQVAAYLDIIFIFKAPIKSGIIKFVPSRLLSFNRYQIGNRPSDDSRMIDELTSFFSNRSLIKLPPNKKIGGMTESESYISSKYPLLKNNQDIARGLGATLCFGHKNNIPLLKLINQYYAAKDDDYFEFEISENATPTMDRSGELMCLLQTPIPKIEDISAEDIVKTREESALFEDYRKALSNGLRDREYFIERDRFERVKNHMLTANEALQKSLNETNVFKKQIKNFGSLMIGTYFSGGANLAVKAASEIEDYSNKSALLSHYSIWQ